MLRIKLYYKPGCWLCDMAQDMINGYKERYGIELEMINIEDDDALYDLYRFDIPVLEFEDGTTLNGQIKKKQLMKAFDDNKK